MAKEAGCNPVKPVRVGGSNPFTRSILNVGLSGPLVAQWQSVRL